MMKAKTLLLTLFFNSILIYSLCQTEVSGGIHSNTTWYASNSPYIVVGDVAVYPNATLTVEAGTTVKFDSAKRLIIRGTLLLPGEQNEKIVFTSNAQNPNKEDWIGIVIENDQGGNVIGSYIRGEYAERFMEIKASSSNEPINLTNSVITHCKFAFFGYEYTSDYTVTLANDSIIGNTLGFVYGQNMTVTNCVFADGDKGLHGWENNLSVVIKNSEFYNLSVYPLNVWAVIDSCYIHDNAVGIRMKPLLEVHNSIIEHNDIGILCNYTGYQVPGEGISNNKICDNYIYNFKNEERFPVNIPNNCWCSDDEEEIGLTIYDGYDNVDLGIVTFTPFDTSCLISSVNGSKIEQLNIFPNPAHDFIKINSRFEVFYEIYSIYGNVLLKGKSSDKINITSLSPGLYLVKIFDKIDNSKMKVIKILKQ